MEVWKFKYRVN